MNQIQINSTAIIFLVILGVTVTACNNKSKTQESPPMNNVSKNNINSNINSDLIVFVNSDSLFNNYDYFKKIKDRFREKSKKAQADLTAKGMAFQKEVVNYQKSAGTLSADQRASTEERLARKQQEISAYNQNISDALMKEEGLENEKLYNNVSNYLKKHAKEKGYKMVLTYSKSNPGLLFADESLDVTKEVIHGLNQEYKNKK